MVVPDVVKDMAEAYAGRKERGELREQIILAGAREAQVEKRINKFREDTSYPLVAEEMELALTLLQEGYSYKNVIMRFPKSMSYQRLRFWMMRGGYSLNGEVGDPDNAPEPYKSFARQFHEAREEGKDRHPEGDTTVGGTLKGRPPRDLSDYEKRNILAAIRAGKKWTYAANFMGIQPTTLLAWMRLGGHPDVAPYRTPVHPSEAREPYKSFVAQVQEVEAKAKSDPIDFKAALREFVPED